MSKYFILFLAVALIACSDKPETTAPDESSNGSTVNDVKIDPVFRPMIHHFSSTGCGPCGRFGIPVFTQVAEEMGDTIFPLITHFKYNDPFIVDASNAITSGIVNSYHSPQIWVNNTEITFDILGKSIPAASAETKAELRKTLNQKPAAFLGLKSEKKPSGRYAIDLAVEHTGTEKGTYYVEVYAMEDSLIASQAGANPFVSTHYYVNRGGHFGGMGKKHMYEPGEIMRESFEFVPCVTCGSELYFYAAVWEETEPGRFRYVNGLSLKGKN